MVQKFISKYIYYVDKDKYNNIIFIYILGFYIDFRKWYYSILDYEEANYKWEGLAWVPEYLLETKDREYFKPIPLSWRIANHISKWKYNKPVRWMAIGYLIARVINT